MRGFDTNRRHFLHIYTQFIIHTIDILHIITIAFPLMLLCSLHGLVSNLVSGPRSSKRSRPRNRELKSAKRDAVVAKPLIVYALRSDERFYAI